MVVAQCPSLKQPFTYHLLPYRRTQGLTFMGGAILEPNNTSLPYKMFQTTGLVVHHTWLLHAAIIPRFPGQVIAGPYPDYCLH